MVDSFGGGTGGLGSASGSISLDAAGAIASLNQFGNALRQTDAQSQQWGSGLSGAIGRNQQAITAAGRGLLGFGAAIVGAFGVGVATAANFEQSMSGVAASLGGVGTAAGVTEQQFQALQDEALRIGASTSKSATEAAQAMDLMARAGIGVETILDGGAQAAVNLSEATGEGLQQSAESMSALMLLFQDTGITASEMADVIVNGMNASNATLSEFQTGIARLAPTIAGTSMSMEEASAAIAYFNSQGFSAAEVGTSLNSAFMRLADPTDEAAAAMQDLGIQAFNAQGEFIGFPALFDQVKVATAGMSEQQRAAALTTIFGADALDVMTLAAINGGAGLAEYTDQMGVAGSAAQNSATRMDNLKGSVEQLKGALETIAIVVGSALTPYVRMAADAATALANGFLNLSPATQRLAAGIVGAVGALSLLSGGFLLMLPRIAATAEALARFGGLSGIIGRVASALRLLAFNPVFLVALAAFAAYRTNFLGFGDAVRAVAGGVGEFANGFMRAFRAFEGNPVERVLRSISAGLKAINGDNTPQFLVTLARGFDSAADGVRRFGTFVRYLLDSFAYLRSQGVNPVSAALKSLNAALNGEAFENVQGPIRTFAQWLDRAGDGIQDALVAFRRFRSAGLDPVSAGLKTLGTLFPGLARFINPVVVAIRSLINNFERFRAAGLDPVRAALTALAAVFPALTGVIIPVIGAITSLANAFLALLSGDLATYFDNLGRAASLAFDALLAAGRLAVDGLVALFRAIDWGGVWDGLSTAAQTAIQAALAVAGQLWDWTLNVGVPTITGWLADTAGNIWDGLKTAAGWVGAVLADLGAWTLATAVPAVTGWIADNASDIWSGLKTAAGWVGDVLADLGAWTLNTAAPAITGWIADNAGDIWSGLKMAAGWVGAILADLGAWTLTTAAPTVTGWVATAAGAVWPLLKSAAGWFGNILADLGSWTLNTAAPAVAGWIATAAGAVWPLLKAAAGWFGNIAADLGSWTLNTAAPTVAGWLTAAAGGFWPAVKAAAGWFGNITADLGYWVLNVVAPSVELDVETITTAITTKIGTVSVALAEWAISFAQDPSIDVPDNIGELVGTAIGAITVQLADWAVELSSDPSITIDIAAILLKVTIALGVLTVALPFIIAVAAVELATDFYQDIEQGISDYLTTDPGRTTELAFDIALTLKNLERTAALFANELILAINTAIALVNMQIPDELGLDIEFVTPVEVPVEADTDPAVETVRNTVDGIENGPPAEAPVSADTSEAEAQVTALRDTMAGQVIVIPIQIGMSAGDVGEAAGGAARGAGELARNMARGAQQQQALPFGNVDLSGINSQLETTASRARDAGRAFSEARGPTDGLATATTALGTAAAAVATFATNAGASISLWASGTQLALGLVETALSTHTTSWTTLSTALSTFSTTAGAAVSMWASGTQLAIGLVETALTTHVTSWTTLSTALATFGTTAGTSISLWASGTQLAIGLVETALTTHTTAWTTLSTALATFSTTAGASVSLWASGTQLAIGLVDTAVAAHGLVWPSLTTVISTFSTSAGTAISSWATGMQAALSLVSLAVGSHAMVWGPLTTVITTFATTTTTAMNTWATALQTAASTTATNVQSSLTTGFQQATAAVRQSTLDMQTSMRSAANAMASSARQAGTDVNTGVSNGMRDASSSVRTEAGKWAGIIDGVAGAMGDAGRRAGEAAGAGVARGLAAYENEVSAAASRIAEIAAAAMRTTLQESSPSKVTTRIGAFAGEGLIDGLLSKLREIVAVSQLIASTIGSTLSRATVDGLQGVYGEGARRLGRLVGELGGAIVQGWEQLTNGFWRNAAGQVVKGIRVEDGGDVNPGFFTRQSGGITGMSWSDYQARLNALRATASTNVTILALPTDEWLRVARAAEAGQVHASAWSDPGALTQYLRGH